MLTQPADHGDVERLASLHRLEILDSPPDEEFEALVKVAAHICGTPIALISLVDATRQWFKANIGLPGVGETPRELAFCEHTIRGTDVMEVRDATLDDRFADNALVTGAPGIRFYAGMPLRLSDGHRVGSICVIDHEPKTLDESQVEALRNLGCAAAQALESWSARRRLRESRRAFEAQSRHQADLIEAFGVGSWEMNIRTGELKLGEAWERLIGSRPADQAALRAVLHPDDRALAYRAMADHLAGRAPRYEVEARVRHRSGAYVWTQSRGTLASRAADGEPEWVFGFIKDITERKDQEEKLRRSEQFLKQTSRLGGVGGWEIDLATGGLHWTSESFRIAGLPPDRQPTADEALGFFAAQDRPRIAAARKRAVDTGEPYELEVGYTRADGVAIWVRSVGSAVFEGGRAVRLVGATQDVTDQVEQRAALQQARERTAMAVNSGGIGVFDWDIIGDTLHWDDWMCRLYGIKRPSIHDTFRIWSRLVHPDDRPAAERAVRDAIDGKRPYDIEFRVIWADGSVHRLHAVATVVRDAAGIALRMVGTNRDVTQHREMASELLRQHELLRVTMQSIGDAVVTTDADGRIGWLNPLAERFTGWSAADAAGRPKTDVIRMLDEMTREDRPDLVSVCLSLGKVVAQEANTLMVSRYGIERPIENTYSPIRDAFGEVLGVVAVFRDVTSTRRLEMERRDREYQLQLANGELERLARHFAKARNIAEQANRAKTRFLASMSHELRTPLNGILGYAQLLRMDGGLTVVQSERLQSMLSAGTHLLEMISCVLDLSEIESEGVELQTASFDLRGLATASMNIVRSAATLKSLSLDVVMAPGVPPVITADPARLRQLLLNLLGNAVKYTESGSVEVRIVAVPASAAFDGPGLRFEVADTGPGISVAQRGRLFREYDRIEAAGSRSVEGAGLGLSLAKKLANLLGGDLGYADNPGGGSVFWFEMPLRADAEPPPPPRASDFTVKEPAPPPAAAAGSRVLVVDDVAMNRDIAAAFMRSAAYEVVCVEGGAEAVASAADDDFLVILMDVRMPDVDGLEATRRIRALDGKRGQVPIVALTAQVFAEQIQACRDAGMDTHVSKPFTPETLLGAIARGVAAAHARSHHAPAKPPREATQPAVATEPVVARPPVMDEGTFDRTSAALKPQAVQSYLEGLSDRAAALKQNLSLRDRSPDAVAASAEAAHALAGSAGMFGFERLMFVARHFERAVKTGDGRAPELAEELDAALTETLEELRRLTEAPIDALCWPGDGRAAVTRA